jgi:hypothetical protein
MLMGDLVNGDGIVRTNFMADTAAHAAIQVDFKLLVFVGYDGWTGQGFITQGAIRAFIGLNFRVKIGTSVSRNRIGDTGTTP